MPAGLWFSLLVGATFRAAAFDSLHYRTRALGGPLEVLMSIVRPFAAIRYKTTPQSLDVSSKLAPPYDVIDADGKAALLARDAANFVKIDLPVVPAKAAGPPEVYAACAAQLGDWLTTGVMVRDEKPQIYVYHQRFRHAGRAYTRKKFFARLRLEPFGQGGVFPHEKTFGGPKEDRLALTKATKANLSPIFGLYEDATNEVSALLERNLPPQPLARGTLDDVESVMWGVSDVEVLRRVSDLMRPRPIYIADGHHRYGTGLMYREWLQSQRGVLPDEHPAQYVLCVFCAMEDPGLLILPTHRVLPNLRIPVGEFKSAGQIEVSPLAPTGPADAITRLATFGPMAIAWYDGPSNQYFVMRPRSVELLDGIAKDHSVAWRRLGLAFLHAFLIDCIVRPKVCHGEEPVIHYVKTADEAVREAKESAGSVFLMQPTTMEELRAVCSAGDLMPQKSTFFWPKLASGLVVNSLE